MVDDAPKERAVSDAGELQPGFESIHRTAGISGAGADGDIAPAGLDLGAHENALRMKFNPTGGVFGLIGSKIQPDNFTARQASGEGQQPDRTVAQTRRSWQGGYNAQDLIGLDRQLLDRWFAVLAPDAVEHVADAENPAIEPPAADD
jgi:hypothetical protein